MSHQLWHAQVPNAVVNHPRSKVLTDPQVVQNELIETIEHPWAAFPMRQPRPAARFSTAPYQLRHYTPLLGEHSREVLAEVGVDPTLIEAAVKNGVTKVVGGKKPDQRVRDGRSYDPSSA